MINKVIIMPRENEELGGDSTGPHGVIMPEKFYKRIARIVEDEHGVGLDELSALDPELAYEYFIRGLSQTLLVGRPSTIDANTGVRVTAEDDGKFAHEAFTNSLTDRAFTKPDGINPFVFEVIVKRRRTIGEFVTRQVAKNEVVLSLTISPPDSK